MNHVGDSFLVMRRGISHHDTSTRRASAGRSGHIMNVISDVTGVAAAAMNTHHGAGVAAAHVESFDIDVITSVRPDLGGGCNDLCAPLLVRQIADASRRGTASAARDCAAGPVRTRRNVNGHAGFCQADSMLDGQPRMPRGAVIRIASTWRYIAVSGGAGCRCSHGNARACPAIAVIYALCCYRLYAVCRCTGRRSIEAARRDGTNE